MAEKKRYVKTKLIQDLFGLSQERVDKMINKNPDSLPVANKFNNGQKIGRDWQIPADEVVRLYRLRENERVVKSLTTIYAEEIEEGLDRIQGIYDFVEGMVIQARAERVRREGRLWLGDLEVWLKRLQEELDNRPLWDDYRP